MGGAKGNSILQCIAGRAVIVNRGRVLIIRESSNYKNGTNNGKYDFPGGKVEPGEELMAGLRREVKEECGLDIEIGKPLYVGEWRPIVDGSPFQIFGIFFQCSSKTTKVILSSDHDDYVWIYPKQRDSYDLIHPNKEVLGLLERA